VSIDHWAFKKIKIPLHNLLASRSFNAEKPLGLDVNFGIKLIFYSFLISSLMSGCTIPNDVIPDKIIVKVIGNNYNWEYHYAGADRKFGTLDDIVSLKNAYIPIGSETEFQVTSNDNIYIFSIPELELIEMGIPDQFTKLYFTPRKDAQYDVEAGQLCGFKHDSLLGEIVVLKRKAYGKWIRQNEQTSIKKTIQNDEI